VGRCCEEELREAELSFLASLVRDAGAAERRRWEELSRCLTETHIYTHTHTHTCTQRRTRSMFTCVPSGCVAFSNRCVVETGSKGKDVSCQGLTGVWRCGSVPAEEALHVLMQR